MGLGTGFPDGIHHLRRSEAVVDGDRDGDDAARLARSLAPRHVDSIRLRTERPMSGGGDEARRHFAGPGAPSPWEMAGTLQVHWAAR